jgi:hypothetical protein
MLASLSKLLFMWAMSKEQRPSSEQVARAERLAAQLRENLKRRKAQARGRRSSDAVSSDGQKGAAEEREG